MINPTGGKVRGNDKWGSGHFGASRGRRTHRGVDYICRPSQTVLAPIGGRVTKLGYPYADDLSYRYVEITRAMWSVRVFYVKPCVKVGDTVKEGDAIGTYQSLDKRYKGITEHVHLEVREGGKIKNPEGIIKCKKSNSGSNPKQSTSGLFLQLCLPFKSIMKAWATRLQR